MKHHFTQKELSRRLVFFYILALSAVALFSVVTQVLIQYSIGQQQNDARVVNIAGRQRMLSQKLCKTAILLVKKNIFLPDAELYYQDIHEIIELWEKCHYGLKSGLLKLETDIPVLNSAVIDSMFRNTEPVFHIMLENAKFIKHHILYPDEKSIPEIQHALQKLLANERTFLTMMDRIVFQYDLEAKNRVEYLKNAELVIFFLTLLILLLEGAFIFRPIHRQVNETIDEIKASEQRQIHLIQQLTDTNSKLIKAKNELVQAAEEKFNLKIKEDKIKSVALLTGQEEERKRLALELHDGLGQMLTGIKLLAEKLSPQMIPSAKEQAILIELKKLIDETIAETRTISFNLMPNVLNDFGIISALKLLIEQTEKSSTVHVQFVHNLEGLTLPKILETTLYRIAQEAINNTIKHAQATLIHIQLLKDSGHITLLISDNGKGFDMRKLKNKTVKNGINNMKLRAEVSEGTFKISSGLAKGTHIVVKLPLFASYSFFILLFSINWFGFVCY